jgi:diaminopimelate epimerase
MKISFTKMQALGNDFILIDKRTKRLQNISRLSRVLCDRRFGIGADQVLVLENSKKADFKMRIFNADGSQVEMCGNGIRCLAKYIWDNKLSIRRSHSRQLKIETPAGIIIPEKSGQLIKVDMGEPELEGKRIPVNQTGRVINHPLVIGGMTFKITCISMGNPHAVVVVNNVQKAPLQKYGSMIENYKFFPKRTNVEFIQIVNRKKIKIRVWERGAGETMACGTGASAAVVTSSLLGLTDRRVTVYLPGGKLLIEWSLKNNHVYMSGPAVKVFDGTIDL